MKTSFQNESNMKTISDKQKLRGFEKKKLQEVLPVEGNQHQMETFIYTNEERAQEIISI